MSVEGEGEGGRWTYVRFFDDLLERVDFAFGERLVVVVLLQEEQTSGLKKMVGSVQRLLQLFQLLRTKIDFAHAQLQIFG